MPTLPQLPPHCTEHHRTYGRGCPACKQYGLIRLRRRRRLLAYGLWQGRVDAAPAAAHIETLVAAGMSINQISQAAGMPWHMVRNIRIGRRRQIYPKTAQCILGIVAETIRSVGVTRRLQALATMGYGQDRIGRWLGIDDRTAGRWQMRPGPFVPVEFHRAVAALYDRLTADDDNPTVLAASRARNKGWYPPEAWTDATIDDPDAVPYADRETCEYVDWVALQKARLPKGHPGRIPFVELRRPEQRVLFDEHRATYPGVREETMVRRFKDIYRPVPISILRELHGNA